MEKHSFKSFLLRFLPRSKKEQQQPKEETRIVKLSVKNPQAGGIVTETVKLQKKNKSAQVKAHLYENGEIDTWTAIQLYGATRLSSIIFNLRKRGIAIDTIPMEQKDRNNNNCKFVVYKLIQDIN